MDGGALMTNQEKRRARCVYCGTTKPVTKSGKIRKHWVKGGPNGPAPGQKIVCGGSGRAV
jgi:hypothetical protein